MSAVLRRVDMIGGFRPTSASPLQLDAKQLYGPKTPLELAANPYAFANRFGDFFIKERSHGLLGNHLYRKWRMRNARN